MTSEIPYATPYPWDNEDIVRAHKRTNETLQKGREFVGSGFAALFQMAFNNNNKNGTMLSDPAKSILMNLLQQHNVPIRHPSSSSTSGTTVASAAVMEDDDEETEESAPDDDSDGGGGHLPKPPKKKKKKTTTTAATTSSSSMDIIGKYGSQLDTNHLQKQPVDVSSSSHTTPPEDSLKTTATPTTLTPTVNDEDVIRHARTGRWSLFLSLLKVVEEESKQEDPSNNNKANDSNDDDDDASNNDSITTPTNSVTTKRLIRSCALTLNPGDVPGTLDAKEMVMAALYFLSSRWEPKRVSSKSSSSSSSSSSMFPSLPLIRPIQAVGDLEKRSYVKDHDWKISSSTFVRQVLQLEQIFLNGPSSTNWKFVPRNKFSPLVSLSGLSPQEEATFFLKGSIPASVTGKKKGEGTRKRKSSTTTTTTGGVATNTAATARAKTNSNNSSMHNKATTAVTTSQSASVSATTTTAKPTTPMVSSLIQAGGATTIGKTMIPATEADDDDDDDDDEEDDEDEDDEDEEVINEPSASSMMMMLEDPNDNDAGSEVVEATVLLDHDDSSSSAASSPSHSIQ